MKEYVSEVASSIKFFVEGEWVDASSDAPMCEVRDVPRVVRRKSQGVLASEPHSPRTALKTLTTT
jgi:hypothetical protein